MSGKLFAFNAGSFSLDGKVEGFLRSKGAIALDFGSSVYINSEAMSAILPELVERSESTNSSAANAEAMVAQLRSELGRFGAERQRLIEENAKIALQAKSLGEQAAALKEQIAGSAKAIETLKVENSRLAAASKSPSSAQPPQAAADGSLRLSYEKLAREFQQLRGQSIEAITSLKVLEEENEGLRDELETLKAQAKNAPPARAG